MATTAHDVGVVPSVPLTAERQVELYRQLVLGRVVDERGVILQRQGRLHFIVSTQGHEAAQVGLAAAMQVGTDYLLGYYRSAPLVLALGLSPEAVLLNLFGRSADPSGGGSNVPGQFADPERRIIATSNVIATQLLHAVGVALALKARGQAAVAVSCFGEGATSAGAFHEALNWAGTHRLPVVFVCENNGYAVSVPQHLQMPIADVAARASGYGMPGVVVDGTDLLAVHQAATAAIARARRGEGPSLLEAKVERIDGRVAPDPVEHFRGKLLAAGLLSHEADSRLWAELKAEVEQAAERAEASENGPASEALRHVYADH